MSTSLRTPLMPAVAYAPTMLFVPVALAGANIAVNVSFMLIGLAVIKLTPVIWLPTLVLGHFGLMIAHSREPHIVPLGQAMSRFKRTSKNLNGVKGGIKYVP